jgi:hypothetical protein
MTNQEKKAWPLAVWFADLRRGPLVRLDGYFDLLERHVEDSAPTGVPHAC